MILFNEFDALLIALTTAPGVRRVLIHVLGKIIHIEFVATGCAAVATNALEGEPDGMD